LTQQTYIFFIKNTKIYPKKSVDKFYYRNIHVVIVCQIYAVKDLAFD